MKSKENIAMNSQTRLNKPNVCVSLKHMRDPKALKANIWDDSQTTVETDLPGSLNSNIGVLTCSSAPLPKMKPKFLKRLTSVDEMVKGVRFISKANTHEVICGNSPVARKLKKSNSNEENGVYIARKNIDFEEILSDIETKTHSELNETFIEESEYMTEVSQTENYLKYLNPIDLKQLGIEDSFNCDKEDWLNINEKDSNEIPTEELDILCPLRR